MSNSPLIKLPGSHKTKQIIQLPSVFPICFPFPSPVVLTNIQTIYVTSFIVRILKGNNMSLACCSTLWYSRSHLFLPQGSFSLLYFFKSRASRARVKRMPPKVGHQKVAWHGRRSCATLAAARQCSVGLLSSCQTFSVPAAEKQGGAAREAIKM